MDKLFSAKFDFGVLPCHEGYTKITPDTIYNKNLGYGFVFDTDEKGNNLINIGAIARHGEGIKYDFCYGDRTDVPLRFDIDVPHNGTYNVKILLGDYDEDTTITVQTEDRRFMLKEKKIKKGEFIEAEFTVNVCDVHRKDEDRFIDRTLNVAVMGEKALINAICVEEVTDAVTIYIAGDSTVTDQNANYPYNPKSTYCGWGQMIGQYINKGVCVSNHAQSGLTTETFMGIHWAVVKERLKKGDFLFMQFGHNDQKVEKLGAFTGYTENLRYYINYAKSIGAYPVLCTPINRIIFEEDGSLRDLLGEYGMAVRKIAKEEGIPCIDLLAKTTEYFIAQGSVDAWGFFWSDGENRDYTHTNDFGGDVIARFVAQGIVQNDIKPIADFIKIDEIKVEFPKNRATVKVKDDNSRELKALSNIGLVNLPKFKDIDKIDVSGKIYELASMGILDSVSEGIFAGDNMLSVKSAVYWAVRAAGIKESDFIKVAVDKKFITEAQIDMDSDITREELAKLVVASYNYRAPDRAIVGNIDQYADRNDIADCYLDDVRAANELGVMRGVSEKQYAPKNTISRLEATEIFYKLVHTN